MGVRHGVAAAVVLGLGCGAPGMEPDESVRVSGAALSATQPGDEACTPPEGILSQSPLSLFEAETTLAHTPDGSIAAVWISNTFDPAQGGAQSIGYRVWRPRCKSGANEWTPVQLITVPSAFYHSDPSVVAGDDGDFYFAFLAMTGDHTPGNNFPEVGVAGYGVYVARLPRDATTTEAPVLVTPPPSTTFALDKPWIGRTPRGAIAVSVAAITDVDTFFTVTLLARSEDHGRTWSTATVDGTGLTAVPQVCDRQGGDRRMYVVENYFGAFDDGAPVAAPRSAELGRPTALRGAHLRAARGRTRPITPGPGSPSDPAIHLHWSDDDGVTWNLEALNTWPTDVPDLLSIPMCVTRDREVWLTAGFFASPTSDNTLVRVGHFVHGGETFAEDFLPNFGDAADLFTPRGVVGDDGNLDAFAIVFPQFTASRADGELVRTHSSDGGRHWRAAQIVEAGLTDDATRHGIGWAGDYVGGDPQKDGAVDVTYTEALPGVPQHVVYRRLGAHH